MTSNQIIEIAKQADQYADEQYKDVWKSTNHLTWKAIWTQRFAELVRNAALEEAAMVCDDLQDVPATEPHHCAQDIRGLKS